jgi:hypothetical protein
MVKSGFAPVNGFFSPSKTGNLYAVFSLEFMPFRQREPTFQRMIRKSSNSPRNSSVLTAR